MSLRLRLLHLVCMLALVTLTPACNEGESFSGSGGKQKDPPQPAEQSEPMPSEDANPPQQDDEDNGFDDDEASDSGEDDETEEDDFEIDPPEDAVTQGSFTAWTEPKDPEPGQDYKIIIEVDLKGDTDNYLRSDLTGFVEGTDFYKQSLNENGNNNAGGLFGGTGGLWDAKEEFDVGQSSARLSMWVPGAMQLVRDRIVIKSDVLEEEQEITLEF